MASKLGRWVRDEDAWNVTLPRTFGAFPNRGRRPGTRWVFCGPHGGHNVGCVIVTSEEDARKRGVLTISVTRSDIGDGPGAHS
jgi:hypothetical protein